MRSSRKGFELDPITLGTIALGIVLVVVFIVIGNNRMPQPVSPSYASTPAAGGTGMGAPYGGGPYGAGMPYGAGPYGGGMPYGAPSGPYGAPSGPGMGGPPGMPPGAVPGAPPAGMRGPGAAPGGPMAPGGGAPGGLGARRGGMGMDEDL